MPMPDTSNPLGRLLRLIDRLARRRDARADKLARLQRALDAAPSPGREIFLLHRVGNVPLPIIAARLEITLEDGEGALADVLVALADAVDG